MNTHTPGPWAQAQYSPADVVVDDKCLIASARYGLNDVSREQAIANARLIAAAPDLLAALSAMLENWEFGGLQPYPIAQVRAAIAKALGE